jgi:hypothetical protein
MSKILLPMDIGLHLQYQVFLSEFIETSIFLRDLKKNTHTSNSIKMYSVRAEFSNVDGQTERHK